MAAPAGRLATERAVARASIRIMIGLVLYPVSPALSSGSWAESWGIENTRNPAAKTIRAQRVVERMDMAPPISEDGGAFGGGLGRFCGTRGQVCGVLQDVRSRRAGALRCAQGRLSAHGYDQRHAAKAPYRAARSP